MNTTIFPHLGHYVTMLLDEIMLNAALTPGAELSPNHRAITDKLSSRGFTICAVEGVGGHPSHNNHVMKFFVHFLHPKVLMVDFFIIDHPWCENLPRVLLCTFDNRHNEERHRHFCQEADLASTYYIEKYLDLIERKS